MNKITLRYKDDFTEVFCETQLIGWVEHNLSKTIEKPYIAWAIVLLPGKLFLGEFYPKQHSISAFDVAVAAIVKRCCPSEKPVPPSTITLKESESFRSKMEKDKPNKKGLFNFF